MLHTGLGCGMEIIDGDKIQCSRCETVIPLSEAVVLERQHNKDMEKPLCEDCLQKVGVPKGYELERDVTYLER
jgi:NAD-dependent SIR2 family protein deacetylase